MEENISGYQEINSAWGQDPRTMRKPTGPEAIKACRLLIKEGFRAFGTGPKDYRIKTKRVFKLTSGRRRTRRLRGVWHVNPNERNQGLAEIVHSVSHYIHRQVHPNHGGHTFHAGIELHLVKYCLKMRWVEDGFKIKSAAPKPKPTRTANMMLRIIRINTRLKTWKTKAKRALTAIKKLEKQAKLLETSTNKNA